MEFAPLYGHAHDFLRRNAGTEVLLVAMERSAPRPPVEVADVIRAAGESFFERSQKWFTWLHLKVLNAILRCRTVALGGHVDACSGCGLFTQNTPVSTRVPNWKPMPVWNRR